MTPLLPPSEMRQSSASSKLSYCSTVTRSPRTAGLSPSFFSKVNRPSFTVHDVGAFLPRYARQPLVDLPSNSNFQPAFFSSGVSVLGLAAGSSAARAPAADKDAHSNEALNNE